jgi:peptidoglycan/xylan/chitin deacetylase (PgdA/CDA1 family)
MSARDVIVLCYHAVSERWDWRYSVSPAALEAQIGGLLERGYVSATFEQAALSPPSHRTVAITFDDAFRSVADLAMPVLQRLGAVATVFAPTDWVDRGAPLTWSTLKGWIGAPHERELEPLAWHELAALRDAGWEIGSHTRSHPRLRELDEATLRRELEGSRLECERRLGQPCATLAYPYGDADARVVRAAGESGYRAAATTAAWTQSAPPLEWPRVVVVRSDDGHAFARNVSLARRRVRASPIGRMREAVRRGVTSA